MERGVRGQMTPVPKDNQTRAANSPKRLFLVDDEVDITTALKAGLEKRGFAVEVYNDPVIALSNFKKGRYDVALLDIRMPGMSGFDLCRKLTAIDGGLKFAFLTAFEVSQDEFSRLFPDIKVHDFMKKPMSIAVLADRLSALVKS